MRSVIKAVEAIEHNGHRVSYDEDDNTWECSSLNLSASSLKALRQKINAIDLAVRRVDNVRALHISSYGSEVEPCIITSIVDAKNCWTTTVRTRGRRLGGGEYTAKEREQCAFESLALDNEDTKLAIARWKRAEAKSREAGNAAEAAKKAIPRLTRAQLLELKVTQAEEEA